MVIDCCIFSDFSFLYIAIASDLDNSKYKLSENFDPNIPSHSMVKKAPSAKHISQCSELLEYF